MCTEYGTSKHTHTHLSLYKIIPLFCLLPWGLWSEFRQHAHRRFLWFCSVTNSQASHSTGMFLCRIFPYVLPEDFMILMRDVWLFSLWKCDLLRNVTAIMTESTQISSCHNWAVIACKQCNEKQMILYSRLIMTRRCRMNQNVSNKDIHVFITCPAK